MRGIMKKFAVLMLALASLGAMTGCDDDDDSVKVPAAVQDTFGRMFPGAGHVEWAGKQGYLVAEFREGGTDMQAWFDAAGKWYMTEEDVPYALLPQAVRTAFESGEYAAWHVDDADKLTREGLETVYVLEVEQRDAEYELVYSEDGVLLRAVPADVEPQNAEDLLVEIADRLLKGSRDALNEHTEWVLHSISCRAAIKAGDKSSPQELMALAEKILSGEVPPFCPHGRPCVLKLTRKELEKQFGRIV